jgi:uracil-DNA glycosylase family 4
MVDFTKILQIRRKQRPSFSSEIAPRRFMPLKQESTPKRAVTSEKMRILSSMKSYVDPILAKKPVQEVAGGEIVRSGPNNLEPEGHVVEFTPHFSSWSDYLLALNKCAQCSDICSPVVVHEFAGVKLEAPLDVLFLSDRPRDFNLTLLQDQNSEEFTQAKSRCFLDEKGVMVERLMASMGRPKSKVALSLITKCPRQERLHDEQMWERCKSNIMHEIYLLKPRFVVTFGAWTTKMLIARQEKLSTIHGQFFPFSLQTPAGEFTTTVVPLFHPDILFLNSEMKKTTWVDLQKIMREL